MSERRERVASSRASASERAASGPAPGRWGLLIGVLRQQRRGLMIGVAIGGVWTVGKLAVPQLIRLAIDRGIVGNGSLWIWPALIVCAGLLAGTFTALRRYVAFREARWTEATLRERLFDHIMSLHVGYHDRSQTGQLMSRASSDLGLIQLFVTMVPITIANLGMILSVFVILFLTDPVLALAAVAPLPFIHIVQRRFSNRIHPVVMELQREQGELATVVEESVTGVRVVKGFGAEQVQIDKVQQEAEDIRRVSLRSARIRSVYLPAIELLPQIGLVAVLGLGGHRVVSGELTIGELVAFNAYVALTVFPLRMLGMTLAWGQRAGVALERVNEVLTTVPAVADPDRPERLPARSPGGAIRFDDVTFGYETSVPVLRDFTLHIDAGRSVALVGGTGSGKSTVARLLVRFYEPDSGPSGSTAWTRRISHCTICAEPSASCSRTRCCSTTRWRPTSPSPAPTPAASRWSGRPSSPELTTSSSSCPTATTRCSASVACRCRVVSASGSHRQGDHRRPTGPRARRRDVIGRPEQGARDP